MINTGTAPKIKFWVTLFVIATFAFTNSNVDLSKQEVKSAMKMATEFMMSEVSNRGGFLWKYSADLSEQWGEIPARKSQIWVQPPGTASVGSVLLQALEVTGDLDYLKHAERVADALIWGQHPSGGWHYLIDFDPAGLANWYDDVASECWGWEEYYHYYGNATFDDDVTISATRFMLDLYLNTQNNKYQEPLLKALDFIIQSQYSNGAWPQRFPLKNEHNNSGQADYTSYYTFNDDVIHGNIMFLLEAYQKLGDEKYKEVAHRGMNFYRLAQLAPPQAGWALQYDLNMKPAWARSYEPASVASGQTVRNITDLQTFYKITGDPNFLNAIPAAIQWLESSVINVDPTKPFTHATFYQLGTNRPLYAHREGTGIEDGRYWVDHEQKNFPGHYGMLRKIDVPAIKREYERVRLLTAKEAHAEYQEFIKAKMEEGSIDNDEIRKIISTLDERGAWLEDLQIPHYPDVVGHPRRIVKGINTQTYISNMQKLMGYINKK
ncbi:MAG: pectate lyase [Saprospiraceae bacterium]|nr:pectate lyase [Saprospiraceae bacterium]